MRQILLLSRYLFRHHVQDLDLQKFVPFFRYRLGGVFFLFDLFVLFLYLTDNDGERWIADETTSSPLFYTYV